MRIIKFICIFACIVVSMLLASNSIAKNKAGATWTEPNTGMKFVWVPKGCFEMGCGEWIYECGKEEKPAHRVCVDGFWIGKYEVTIDQYRKFLQMTGHTEGVDWDSRACPIKKDGSYSLSGNKYGQDGDQPMVEVSWYSASKFADWLSEQSSREFRLPTEAEWEYAARSGGKKEIYAGGDDVDRFAWYKGNSYEHTHKVGTKAPNGLGIYDMSGNVWEWCQDWFSHSAYNSHSKNNPGRVAGKGSYRSERGGGSWNDSVGVRTTIRTGAQPGITLRDAGFRLCIPGKK